MVYLFVEGTLKKIVELMMNKMMKKKKKKKDKKDCNSEIILTITKRKTK